MTQQILSEQNEALVNFLDDLLTEELQDESILSVPSGDPVEPPDTPIPAPRVDTPAEDEKPGLEEAKAADSAEAAFTEIQMGEPDVRVPIVPDWGAEAFQAMVFKVEELSLAIPMVALAGVAEWRPELLDPAAAGGLCLGHYRHAGQNVAVIDTARFIFPEQHPAICSGSAVSQGLSRIILIDKGNIGLVCNAVYEVISIQPEQVSWRSVRTRRKWLAGTVMSQLIVVLDTCTTTEILRHELDMGR